MERVTVMAILAMLITGWVISKKPKCTTTYIFKKLKKWETSMGRVTLMVILAMYITGWVISKKPKSTTTYIFK